MLLLVTVVASMFPGLLRQKVDSDVFRQKKGSDRHIDYADPIRVLCQRTGDCALIVLSVQVRMISRDLP